MPEIEFIECYDRKYIQFYKHFPICFVYFSRLVMIQTKIFNEQNKPSESEKSEVVDFLFDNLQEYGDPKHQIERAIDYSTKEFYDAKKIIDATENVAELSRVEALELHEELLQLKKENKELELQIKSIMKENMDLKKRH